MRWLLYLCIGIVIGILGATIASAVSGASGVLRIDHSNPEKDIYRFEIDNIEKLSKKKAIVLKIDNQADLSSQK